jgi:hypothetical protein
MSDFTSLDSSPRSATSHWADRYLGEPWVAGSHDCWLFARRVWSERFGWHVPALEVDALDRLASLRAFAEHHEYRHWAAVDAPASTLCEGDACLMGKSHRASHIGVVIQIPGAGSGCSGLGVLHCLQGSGVVFTPHERLCVLGLRAIAHYRYKLASSVLAPSPSTQKPGGGPATGAHHA